MTHQCRLVPAFRFSERSVASGLPPMPWFARSAVSHARILSVDTQAAKRLRAS